MPITIAFTITSSIALVANGLFLYSAVRQDLERRRRGENGRLGKIATAFLLIWAAIVIEDLMMLGAGAGILVGLRVFGYLLALMPLVSVFIGVFALRGLR